MSYVVGAAAVTRFGFEWRGLGQFALNPGKANPRSLQLSTPTLERELGNTRAQRLMSRSAQLAAVAVHRVLQDAHWSERRGEIGYFLGVGASSGGMDQLLPVLRAAITEAGFSLDRLAVEGLSACNPLLTFQLLNNFTLCHGAILEGTGGPNGAFFSRGSGTVFALLEGMQALREGTCERVLVGGADCANHPVTLSELKREGFIEGGLVATEGAAILALTAGASEGLARVEHCALHSTRSQPWIKVIENALAALPFDSVDFLLLVPWGKARRRELSLALEQLSAQRTLDLSEIFGESLAAAPAVAWAVGLDLLLSKSARSVLILSAGIDGDLGVVALTSQAKS
jgi:hypothetical protein